ncbi:MAG: response regulator [Planctomycetes bacterium]|nr:response regulator [Planctomycetota bacterium]
MTTKLEPRRRPATRRVMVVEDDKSIRSLIAMSLSPEFEPVPAMDGQDALEILAKMEVLPVVILTDVSMPRMDGLELAKRARADQRLREIPIIMVTANADREFKLQALELGVDDYVLKPFDLAEVKLRVRNLANVSIARHLVETYADELERRVEERTRELTRTMSELSAIDTELREARWETILRLSVACEYRDDDTAQHLKRMATYSQIIARNLGLSRVQVEMITVAAPMHDVGKIGVPDNILLKPGKLTSEEFKVMQKHPGMGARILAGSNSPLMKTAEAIALTHHERFDGKGYPRGLKGEDIPIEGRIVALADVFDALTTQRVYKPAFPIERSLEIIREGDGSHFDPKVTSAFFGAISAVKDVCNSMHTDDKMFLGGALK